MKKKLRMTPLCTLAMVLKYRNDARKYRRLYAGAFVLSEKDRQLRRIAEAEAACYSAMIAWLHDYVLFAETEERRSQYIEKYLKYEADEYRTLLEKKRNLRSRELAVGGKFREVEVY